MSWVQTKLRKIAKGKCVSDGRGRQSALGYGWVKWLVYTLKTHTVTYLIHPCLFLLLPPTKERLDSTMDSKKKKKSWEQGPRTGDSILTSKLWAFSVRHSKTSAKPVRPFRSRGAGQKPCRLACLVVVGAVRMHITPCCICLDWAFPIRGPVRHTVFRTVPTLVCECCGYLITMRSSLWMK